VTTAKRSAALGLLGILLGFGQETDKAKKPAPDAVFKVFYLPAKEDGDQPFKRGELAEGRLQLFLAGTGQKWDFTADGGTPTAEEAASSMAGLAVSKKQIEGKGYCAVDIYIKNEGQEKLSAIYSFVPAPLPTDLNACRPLERRLTELLPKRKLDSTSASTPSNTTAERPPVKPLEVSEAKPKPEETPTSKPRLQTSQFNVYQTVAEELPARQVKLCEDCQARRIACGGLEGYRRCSNLFKGTYPCGDTRCRSQSCSGLLSVGENGIALSRADASSACATFTALLSRVRVPIAVGQNGKSLVLRIERPSSSAVDTFTLYTEGTGTDAATMRLAIEEAVAWDRNFNQKR